MNVRSAKGATVRKPKRRSKKTLSRGKVKQVAARKVARHKSTLPPKRGKKKQDVDLLELLKYDKQLFKEEQKAAREKLKEVKKAAAEQGSDPTPFDRKAKPKDYTKEKGYNPIISQDIFDRSVVDYSAMMLNLSGGKMFIQRGDGIYPLTLHGLNRLMRKLSRAYNEDKPRGKRAYPFIIPIDFNEITGDVFVRWDEVEFPYLDTDIDLNDIH